MEHGFTGSFIERCSKFFRVIFIIICALSTLYMFTGNRNIGTYDVSNQMLLSPEFITQGNTINHDTMYRYNDSTIIKHGNNVHNLWHLDIMDGTLDGVHMYNRTGMGVNIVIVDFIVSDHNDFTSRLHKLCTNDNRFDSDPGILHHGTECAGLAAGTVYGVAKDAEIYHYSIKKAMIGDRFAINHKLIEDLMIRTRDICSEDMKCVLLIPMGSYHSDTSYLDPLIASNRYIIITPSGNDGLNLDSVKIPYNPASMLDTISVGSFTLDSNKNFVRSNESNYGSVVDLYAPGEFMATTGVGGQVVINHGTSLAAAQAAGWVGTILESDPGSGAGRIREIISALPMVGGMRIMRSIE